MKAVTKLVVLLGLSTLATVVASASTGEQTYLEHCRKGPDVPVPIAVVSPVIEGDYIGTSVQLEFVVDQTGKPADMIVKSAPDDTVAAAVMDAVKKWRFKPAERNGVPVATKVALPVNVVERPLDGSTYASN